MVRIAAGISFDRVEDGNLEGTRLAIRIHANRQNGVVILFAVSTLLLNLLLIGPFIFQFQQQVHGPSTAWIYSYVGHIAMSVIASIFGILIGGGLLRDRSTTAS